MPSPRALLGVTGDGSDTTSGATLSPYVQATESIRAAARWLLAAFAAVGGVLVAGVPLTDLGRVGVWNFRFWIAVAAIVAALGAIGWMIRAVARVFTAEYVSFGELRQADFPEKVKRPRTPEGPDDLRSKTAEKRSRRQRRVHDIREVIDTSREELYGSQARSLAELSRLLRKANEVLSQPVGADAPASQQLESELWARRQPELNRAALRVVDFANYEFTRRMFKSLFPKLAFLGFIAAAGVGAYAVAVSSAPPKAPTVDKPIAVTLTLRPGARKWGNLLGSACDIRSVRAVAVAGSLNAPEVVTDQTDTCRAARFRVGRKQGVAVPVTGAGQ
jgi:hypothetical protein